MLHLDKLKTAVFICDVQPVYSRASQFSKVLNTSKFILDVASVLEMKIVFTELIPDVYKNTMSDLSVNNLKSIHTCVFSKSKLSMITHEVDAHIEQIGCSSVLLCGMETHTSILHTAIDLIDKGVHVYVCLDGITSLNNLEHEIAIRHSFPSANITLCTAETFVFQLISDLNSSDFKKVAPFIHKRDLFYNKSA